jgi:magnesium-transporting ATPase (P-type)
VFANIPKFLRYLLSSNIGEVLRMFFGVVLARRLGLHGGGDGLVVPLLATQILWINLVTDGLPALALGRRHGRAVSWKVQVSCVPSPGGLCLASGTKSLED